MYETRLPVQASAEETGSLQWEGGVGDQKMGMYLYGHFSIPKSSLLWSYDWGVLAPYKRDGLGECDRSFL